MTTTARPVNELLARTLESIVGAQHITIAPELEIDGLKPSVLVRPGTGEEVAASLGACREMNAAVVPAGKMSWLDAGNPLRRADVLLSLERMNRIVEYSPSDLTATLEAGCGLTEFNSKAKENKQWLPLDPPGADSASIGAVVACASSGPLRFGLGTPRDYVIGLHLAHPDGKVSKSGGKVVKNVAGYDLNKLYTGSFGTLAVITEVTVKLRPAPERIATVAVSLADQKPFFSLTSLVLRSSLRPVSLVVVNPNLSARLGLREGRTCLVRFAGGDEEVHHQVKILSSMAGSAHVTELGQNDSDRAWNIVANIDRLHPCTVKLSVPMTRVGDSYSSCEEIGECVISADAGTGIVRVAFDPGREGSTDIVASLRSMAHSLGGNAFLERAPLAVRKQIDSWGDPGPAVVLMQAVKTRFDPRAILNPGKFVKGI